MFTSLFCSFICSSFAIDASIWSGTTFADYVAHNDASTLVVSNLELTGARDMYFYNAEIYRVLNRHAHIKHLVFVNVTIDRVDYFFKKLRYVETVTLMSVRPSKPIPAYSFLFSSCCQLSKVNYIDSPELASLPESDTTTYYNVPSLYAYKHLMDEPKICEVADEPDYPYTPPFEYQSPFDDINYTAAIEESELNIKRMQRYSIYLEILLILEIIILISLVIYYCLEKMFESFFGDVANSLGCIASFQ